MKLDFSLSVEHGVEVGRKNRVNKAREAIRERKEAREKLLKESAELEARAEACRLTDPAKSRSLKHRSIALQNEEYRIRKENEKPMTYDQLRRSALLAQCALLVDGMKDKTR